MGSNADVVIRIEAGEKIGAFDQELMGSDIEVTGVLREVKTDDDAHNPGEHHDGETDDDKHGDGDTDDDEHGDGEHVEDADTEEAHKVIAESQEDAEIVYFIEGLKSKEL